MAELKKEKYVAKGGNCCHCEAEKPQMEVLERGVICLYCDPDCARAQHRDRSREPIQQEIARITLSLGLLSRLDRNRKQYKAMWASRASLQAILDRDEIAFKMYQKRGQELWAECLEECEHDGKTVVTAEFMKLWFEMCSMCAPAYITAVPYETIALPPSELP